MKKYLLVWSAVLLGAFGAAAQTSAPTKVGTIHIQNAIISTKDGQRAAAELESKSAPKKRELERLQGEIAAMRDQLNKTSSVGSEEQKNRLIRDIDAKTKSFNRQVEDAQAELDQEQNRVLNEIGGRMLQVLDKYARDNGYAVILDVSNQNTPVLFASNTIDVTQEIVGLYDKNAPSATSTGAVPPAATRPAAPAATKPAATGVRPGTPAAKPGATK